jgi:hypothetical protein
VGLGTGRCPLPEVRVCALFLLGASWDDDDVLIRTGATCCGADCTLAREPTGESSLSALRLRRGCCVVDFVRLRDREKEVEECSEASGGIVGVTTGGG